MDKILDKYSLNEMNHLYLGDHIEHKQEEILIKRILEPENDKPFLLRINSNGGYVDSGLFIYDNIVHAPVPVVGLVIGKCFSMASVILQACHQRLALPHSLFLVHHIKSNFKFEIRLNKPEDEIVKDINDKLNNKLIDIKKDEEYINEILRKKCTHMDEVFRLKKSDEPFDAKKAKEIGIIDEIYHSI